MTNLPNNRLKMMYKSSTIILYFLIYTYFIDLSRYVIQGEKDAINPENKGTKMAAHYALEVEGGKSVVVKLRLTNNAIFSDKISPFGRDFDLIFLDRVRESDEFYEGLLHKNLSDQEIMVSRQAYAGEGGRGGGGREKEYKSGQVSNY